MYIVRLSVYCLFSIVLISSCAPYKFAKEGYVINGVDEYFNLKKEMNIWVYMDYYLDKGEKGDRGVRTRSLYESDIRLLKYIGLKRKDIQILFTAVPKYSIPYHLIVMEYQKQPTVDDTYKIEQGQEGYYLYKDTIWDDYQVRSVLIPYGQDKMLGMIYYIHKVDVPTYKPMAKIDYLSSINARELQKKTSFNKSWQVYDCGYSDLIEVTVDVKNYLTKKEKVVFMKMYAVYGNGNEIAYMKILTKDSKSDLTLNLCPNEYLIEYESTKGEVLERDSLILMN